MSFIAEQVYIFLYAILAGALAAFLYDILRIKRRAFKTGVIFVSLEDLLYWLVAAVLLFLMVYNSNSGQMRGFILIGNIIGVALYEATLSKIFIASSVMIINLIKRFLMFTWKIISFPFKLVFKILSVPVAFIFKLIFKILKFFGGIIAKIYIKAGGAAAAGSKRIGRTVKTKAKALGTKAGGFTKKGVKVITHRGRKKKRAEKQEFLP